MRGRCQARPPDPADSPSTVQAAHTPPRGLPFAPNRLKSSAPSSLFIVRGARSKFAVALGIEPLNRTFGEAKRVLKLERGGLERGDAAVAVRSTFLRVIGFGSGL